MKDIVIISAPTALNKVFMYMEDLISFSNEIECIPILTDCPFFSIADLKTAHYCDTAMMDENEFKKESCLLRPHSQLPDGYRYNILINDFEDALKTADSKSLFVYVLPDQIQNAVQVIKPVAGRLTTVLVLPEPEKSVMNHLAVWNRDVESYKWTYFEVQQYNEFYDQILVITDTKDVRILMDTINSNVQSRFDTQVYLKKLKTLIEDLEEENSNKGLELFLDQMQKCDEEAETD